jgi:predicted small lipoprotein YifL
MHTIINEYKIEPQEDKMRVIISSSIVAILLALLVIVSLSGCSTKQVPMEMPKIETGDIRHSNPISIEYEILEED